MATHTAPYPERMRTRQLPDVFTVDDLDWLKEEWGLGAFHIEIDPWGNLVMSPRKWSHVLALNEVVKNLTRQLEGAPAMAVVEGPNLKVAGGSGYENLPDGFVVLPFEDGRWTAHDDEMRRPPLMVIEVASPSTRTIDRTRKADDYRIEGAELYLLVDLPTAAKVDAPVLELWRNAGDHWDVVAKGPAITFELAGRTVTLDAAEFKE